jgi:multimeric flavodoxin WrbA
LKILSIIGTARKGGIVNSISGEILSQAGANGHQTETVNLYDRKIEYCRGCCRCLESGKCIHDDDFGIVLEKSIGSDVIILGTPVYYGSVSSIMKNYFDRHMSLGIEKIDYSGKAEEIKDLPFFSRVKALLGTNKSMESRKIKNPLYGKKFIFIAALTKPFPFSHLYPFDVSMTLGLLNKFVYQIGGKKIKTFLYTDSAFGLLKNKKESYFNKSRKFAGKLI